MPASRPVTLSVGVVTFEDFTLTINDMIKHADSLMYTVKQKEKKPDPIHGIP